MTCLSCFKRVCIIHVSYAVRSMSTQLDLLTRKHCPLLINLICWEITKALNHISWSTPLLIANFSYLDGMRLLKQQTVKGNILVIATLWGRSVYCVWDYRSIHIRGHPHAKIQIIHIPMCTHVVIDDVYAQLYAYKHLYIITPDWMLVNKYLICRSSHCNSFDDRAPY